jgi:hypothetical protein
LKRYKKHPNRIEDELSSREMEDFITEKDALILLDEGTLEKEVPSGETDIEELIDDSVTRLEELLSDPNTGYYTDAVISAKLVGNKIIFTAK